MFMIIGDSYDYEFDNKFQFDRVYKGICQILVGRFCFVDFKIYYSIMNFLKIRGVLRYELLNYLQYYQIN